MTVSREIRLSAGEINHGTAPGVGTYFTVTCHLGDAGHLILMVYRENGRWRSHGLCCTDYDLRNIPEAHALDGRRDWGETQDEAMRAMNAALEAAPRILLDTPRTP